MQELSLSKERDFGAGLYRKVSDAQEYVRDNLTKNTIGSKVVGALFTFLIAFVSLAMRSFNFLNLLGGLRFAVTDFLFVCEDVFCLLFTKGATDLFGSAFVDIFVFIASLLTATLMLHAVQNDDLVVHDKVP